MDKLTVATRPGSGKSSINGTVRVIAIFLHGSVWGEQIAGSAKRFLEVSRALSLAGISLSSLEFSPPLPRPPGAGQPFVLPRRWEPLSLRRVVNIFRLALVATAWGWRLKCEVVYSPDRMSYQLIPACFASFLLRRPLVIVVHSFDIEEARIPMVRFVRTQLRSENGLKKGVARIAIDILTRLGYRRASAFLAVSNTTAGQIVAGLNPRRVVVSGNAVGQDWFDLPQVSKTQDACFLGTISPEKRQELLILTWKEVSKRRPDARLVLIGGSSGMGYEKRCKNLIRELGLENNVMMTGFVDEAEARNLVSSSRVFISASNREGFGLSILEAMAAGLPCVVSDIPALRETFGGTAVLVDSSDPSTWADAVLRLLDDNKLAEDLSISGRNLATRFRWGTVGLKEAELMRSMARHKKGSHVQDSRQMGLLATERVNLARFEA
jgi:glycosyltransferase involved in cell wall biosynthesis